MNNELSDRVQNSSFPVDLIYTWVYGSDGELMAKRSRYASQPIDPLEESAGASLLTEFGVVARGVGLSNLFVADKQVPTWLYRDHPQMCLVDHSEISCWLEDLPTYNSHAIECSLHQIPRL